MPSSSNKVNVEKNKSIYFIGLNEYLKPINKYIKYDWPTENF